MDRIDIAKVKELCSKKGLKPSAVKGTKGVAITKGLNDRFEIITWEEFEDRLKARGLAVYESGGWMKIMKA